MEYESTKYLVKTLFQSKNSYEKYKENLGSVQTYE